MICVVDWQAQAVFWNESNRQLTYLVIEFSTDVWFTKSLNEFGAVFGTETNVCTSTEKRIKMFA